MSLMGKVLVVTGGSRGIGRAVVLLAAERGYSVCFSYASNSAAAEDVVARVRAKGGMAVAVKSDVAKEADVVALFAAADRLGPLDALVNNAGIVDCSARVDEMTAERLSRMFAINVIGSILCAREGVRRMSTRHGGQGGAIVNLSSAATRLGGAGVFVDYAASKAAIDALTLGLGREVAAEGIRVTAVSPGLIDTDIHASSGVPNRLEHLRSQVPMQRIGRPEEVAAAILWLMSEEASYITATTLDVSGGR
jgi:NAD(P)-dependent dehydrogenase (short-subunit alcohol dehydrogenase family)